MASLVGSRVERKEDKKLLTGRGRYTADVNFVHQTFAYFVRSPHARAQIKKVDTSKALKSPGVVSILTGADIVKDKIGGLIAGWRIKSEDGSDMKVPPHPPLASDTVNYVGDHVAVVIAETLDQARNAAELVKVDYKILKAVVSTKDAMSSDQIYKDVPKDLIPSTESLKDTYNRVIRFFEEEIREKLRDTNILISAHGNSIRALCKKLFELDNSLISNLEIPTGNPLLIKLDNSLKITKCEYLDKKRAKDLLVFWKFLN